MISYEGLKKQLALKQLNISDLSEKIGISSRTIAKINRNEKVADCVLRKLCRYFDCERKDLIQEFSDNKLLRILKEEKDHKISGGFYHELQIRMTFNSNHIEGSKLSEDQTRMIFETNTIDTGDGIPVDDVLETIHHFRAIDYCIDIAEEELTEEHFKKLHYLLKHDTKDSELSWFAVGDYKKRPNVIGGLETAKPEEVKGRIQKLLFDYNQIEKIGLEDIVSFHAEFEKIHPFQDGNGRVGRLIAFKECLHHHIIPFIIEDSKKAFYYRGLFKWNEEKGFLLETCLDGQYTMKAILKTFAIQPDEDETD